MQQSASYDVIVVGSGACGMLAAVCAADFGLRSVLIEKSDRYGGTSAVSGGGVWVPCNPDIRSEDSIGSALTYLKGCTRGLADEARLVAFLADAPRMIDYVVNKAKVPLRSIRGFPDYHSRLPGASFGRVMMPDSLDGKLLGEEYFRLRQAFGYLKLLGRISLNAAEGGILGAKAPGWQRVMLRLLCAYWLDFGWRRRTSRDRRLCNGEALVGYLRKAMLERNVPLLLNSALVRLCTSGGRTTGVIVEHNGWEREMHAAHGVVLAAGGFEANQQMRERYLEAPGHWRFSAPPRGINGGDAITAGVELGAALGGMKYAWKVPVLVMPVIGETNVDYAHPFFWDRGAPGSICVNRQGRRFVDEAVTYDEFCAAMLGDDTATHLNAPCWMIFDAACRRRSLLGPLLPGEMKPDGRLPPEWLDSVYFRAESLDELAAKIGVDGTALAETVRAFNVDARLGKDRQFDRGGCSYDKYFANPRIKPNGSLAPLDAGPYYALRLDVGDLGTKGGLITNAVGQVLREGGSPIPGLYAAGNTAASIFGNSYPGPGGTLAPAMTQAFVAIEHLSQQNGLAQQRRSGVRNEPYRSETY